MNPNCFVGKSSNFQNKWQNKWWIPVVLWESQTIWYFQLHFSSPASSLFNPAPQTSKHKNKEATKTCVWFSSLVPTHYHCFFLTNPQYVEFLISSNSNLQGLQTRTVGSIGYHPDSEKFSHNSESVCEFFSNCEEFCWNFSKTVNSFVEILNSVLIFVNTPALSVSTRNTFCLATSLFNASVFPDLPQPR